MIRHVAVLGSGSWGTALAFTAAHKAERVTLWGRDAAVVAEINEKHANSAYLPCAALQENIRAVTDLKAAADADVVFFVVPSKAMRSVAEALKTGAKLRPGAVLLSATKGIENGTGLRMTQILREYFPDHPVAVLSGPNHAEEIVARLAAAAVVGCEDEATNIELQHFFTLPWFRTYRSDDVTGIEWGGAAKNIFAIASGAAEGLGLGDNARAALVTRALAEMSRLGMAMGGRFETFQGLSGVGDLIVTCFSRHSRNNRVGRLLGQGRSLESITAEMKMIAEGIPNTESIYHAARRCGVRTPLIDEVYAVLYQRKPCAQAFADLLAREPRPENE